jgi:hypothetical protein
MRDAPLAVGGERVIGPVRRPTRPRDQDTRERSLGSLTRDDVSALISSYSRCWTHALPALRVPRVELDAPAPRALSPEQLRAVRRETDRLGASRDRDDGSAAAHRVAETYATLWARLD